MEFNRPISKLITANSMFYAYNKIILKYGWKRSHLKFKINLLITGILLLFQIWVWLEHLYTLVTYSLLAPITYNKDATLNPPGLWRFRVCTTRLKLGRSHFFRKLLGQGWRVSLSILSINNGVLHLHWSRLTTKLPCLKYFISKYEMEFLWMASYYSIGLVLPLD